MNEHVFECLGRCLAWDVVFETAFETDILLYVLCNCVWWRTEAASAAPAATGQVDIDLTEIYTVMTPEEAARKEAEEDARWASLQVFSEAYTAQDLQPDSSDEERLSAAPAARQGGRLSSWEAGGRLAFMSWNAGGGAKNLAGVIDEVGNHIVAIQEAYIEKLQVLDRWNFVCENDQFIACRKPSTIKTLAVGKEEGKCWWHVAEVLLDRPRLGLKNIVVLSLHLNNIVAKKRVAGPECLGRCISSALQQLRDARQPSVDIICGDLNGACGTDATLGHLESCRMIPVALWSGECCS